MKWTIHPPIDDEPIHRDEDHVIVLPLDDTEELFRQTRETWSGPQGDLRTVTRRAVHVAAGCNHLVDYHPGQPIGRCEYCERWLCQICANRIVCHKCAIRICAADCTKLIDGVPHCPSCARMAKLKRLGAALHGFLKREF